MRILLFLGSGVSFKTGLPDTKKITDRLLNEDWHQSTHINFYPGKHGHEYSDKKDIARKLQVFLKFLKDYSDKYLKDRGNNEATYEDLFYIVKQVHDELFMESDNPAIKPFIEYILKELNYPENEIFIEYDKPMEFRDFCWRAMDFIQCVVWNSVLSNKDPIGYDLLSEFAFCDEITKLNIITLNHDQLTEKYFKKNNIEFSDGFGSANGDYCLFDPILYNNKNVKINIYKPHGSIDWFRLRLDEGDLFTKLVGNDYLRIFDGEGNFIGTPLNSFPIFLSGSGNKTEGYNSGIFRDVLLYLDHELYNSNTMIMSGYGWNDKGINQRIMQWFYSSEEKRIILLHENPESIKLSRSAMYREYDGLVKKGRLIPVRKWMSDTKLEDVLKYL